MTGSFQTDPIKKSFGLYQFVNGRNYHISEKSLIYAKKKSSGSQIKLIFQKI